ncbi:MAG: sugar ABC transporter permease [Oscillospiraceae bacterium]|nr:sugar ABC transporter permease [Oscillospiraceae bacterium]
MKTKKIRQGGKIDRWGYIFVAPFIIGILVFTLYPVGDMFFKSFTNATNRAFNQELEVIGFANYQTVLGNQSFITSIGTTWKIWIISFIPQLGIALMISAWFTSVRLRLKCVGLFRTVFYMPNLLMSATVAALYTTLFSNLGPINRMLINLGLITEPIFFRDTPSFMVGLVAYLQWWLWFGVTIVLLMAGMTSISPSLYESATVDGANGGQMFFKITLPLLRPVMLYVLVTSLVGGMQMMDIPYMINGENRPGGRMGEFATMNVVMTNTYFNGNSTRNLGLASAAGMVIFAVTLVAALILLAIMNIGKDDDSKLEKKRLKRLNKESKLGKAVLS